MCPLFKGRIDPTSKTLSKKSTFLFLANQLRQLVKELLAGTYAIADVEFEKRAQLLLGQEDQYNEAVQKFVEYINYITGFAQDPATGEWKSDPSIQAIPVWNEIAMLPLGTLQISQVPVKREEGWICLTATGLNMIGRFGHQLFTNATLQQNWKHYAAKSADPQIIDWKRSAPMGQTNIVQGNKLLTQQGPVKRAYDQVAYAIGLPGALPVQPPAPAPDTKQAVNA